jgi:hypothetical protein
MYWSKQFVYIFFLLLYSPSSSAIIEKETVHIREGCGVGVKKGHAVLSSPPGVAAAADCRGRAPVLRVRVMTDTSHHHTFMYC